MNPYEFKTRVFVVFPKLLMFIRRATIMVIRIQACKERNELNGALAQFFLFSTVSLSMDQCLLSTGVMKCLAFKFQIINHQNLIANHKNNIVRATICMKSKLMTHIFVIIG